MTKLNFDKMQGLIPAVLQEADSGEVLMLGFMNPAALAETLRNGYATFFSRTRNQLWTKGETSGNRAQVISISTDCDRDTGTLPSEHIAAGTGHAHPQQLRRSFRQVRAAFMHQDLQIVRIIRVKPPLKQRMIAPSTHARAPY